VPSASAKIESRSIPWRIAPYFEFSSAAYLQAASCHVLLQKFFRVFLRDSQAARLTHASDPRKINFRKSG
jgi:hypothetical protein